MIYILDENLKIVDILRKYNFAQYNNRFRDIGAFKINAQLVDENIYILDETKQYYVLFDFDEYIFGQVTKVKQSGEGDNDKEIVIEGKLSKYILTKRVINGTINYKGKTFGLVKEIIDSNIVSSSNVKRNLPIEIIYDEEYLTSVCSDVTKQITGGYVWEEAEKLLTQDNLGIDFVPNIITDSNTTNIDKWYLTINAGVDRTKTNKYGNNPVIFSQQLSNIASVDYERDVEEYTNYAYVAGEGEEENRKWYEINRTNKDASGWNRKELWIDARDVQSENKDGTILSETEYEKLIKERANEKFSESDVQESYEATLTEKNAQYTYGVDYNLGDWCTITDINLNKELDVQITEITVTVQGTRKIVDVGFTYGLIKKDPIKQTQQNTININKTENNVRYLENITKPFTKAFSFLRDATGKITGMAIGKVAEIENALEVAWKVYCRKGLAVTGNVQIYKANGDNNARLQVEDKNVLMISGNSALLGSIAEGAYIYFRPNGVSSTDGQMYLDNSGHLRMVNGATIYAMNTSGYWRNNIEPCTKGNACSIGYGGYSANEGATQIWGKEISLSGKDGIGFTTSGGVYISSPLAGIAGRAYGVNKVLWSGGWYMNASQTATLSESASAQPHGIVLVWCNYNVSTGKHDENSSLSAFFIPKYLLSSTQKSFDMIMSSGKFAVPSCKSVFVYNTKVVGTGNNEASGTASGITYNNQKKVLLYVLGV